MSASTYKPPCGDRGRGRSQEYVLPPCLYPTPPPPSYLRVQRAEPEEVGPVGRRHQAAVCLVRLLAAPFAHEGSGALVGVVVEAVRRVGARVDAHQRRRVGRVRHSVVDERNPPHLPRFALGAVERKLLYPVALVDGGVGGVDSHTLELRLVRRRRGGVLRRHADLLLVQPAARRGGSKVRGRRRELGDGERLSPRNPLEPKGGRSWWRERR